MKECDISKTGLLHELLAMPGEQRDDVWLDRFYSTVVDASFRCENPQVFTGPDRFPYFSLLSPEPMKPFDSFCICNIAEFVTEHGFGVAINRSEDGVDWVFSYGDLLQLRLTGSLKPEPAIEQDSHTETIQQKESVLVGAPAAEYLPDYARSVLRDFMQRALGISEPMVFLMSRPSDPRPMQLVFSIFREQYESEEDYFSVLKHLSWFLPRHYSITGIPMDSDLCRNFAAL